MSTYSSMRAMRRLSRPDWVVAVLVAALAACAPVPPATVEPAVQPTVQPAAIQPAVQPGTRAGAQATARPADGPLPVPPNLVALAQPAGQKRLLGSVSNQSYWPLSQYFETQRNEAYCSVATSVMALNALGIRRPESTQYPDFPFFSQEDFFRGIEPLVANAAQVSREGMTLDQLSAALNAFPVAVGKYHASDLSLDQFRDLVRATTGRNDRFVLLNFRRMEIGETGGGHWSPLAAYDAASDSALLLDVARYKYPALWVPVAQLYAAALAVDSVSGLSRGIVIVGKRQN
ncbi:phytochelatin synthase family protein [Paraburkholderia aromaticivorans]|uniref:glutathione gamma-glutamylcysteinyltransferase n=1 Tax=Paraburkholderia aromaticivorans TaxID=2026199 RepID=A0A248VPS0_9BURK|nr:phytochelatin synthase family protein [Paraburkholderia aromaticivorans]ASW01038.1 phytochelatin synthase [Paraburkholderia aromaticivorans]